MARINTLSNFLTDVATAIKNKKGNNAPIKASDFDTEITNLPSGGSGTPKVGFTVDEWNSSGYTTKVTVYGIEKIPNYAFASANVNSKTLLTSYLTEVILPDNITSIGQNAFAYSSNLSKINLPNSITSIGQYAFTNCSNLSIKTLPDGLTTIQPSTFPRCTSLIQLSMNGVEKINASSSSQSPFSNCTGFKAVWLGSAIQSITLHSFNGCTNLSKIFIDLPRSTVEAMGGYSSGFSNGTVSKDVIICNDDEGFITKDEFDAIDWSVV